jgi:hypothetical protein
MSSEVQALRRALPPHLSTQHLAAQHPHVLEKIAALWIKPNQLRPYLDDLMMPARLGRKGFTADVTMEIVGLKSHYVRLMQKPEPVQNKRGVG